MKKIITLITMLLLFMTTLFAQQQPDTTVNPELKYITEKVSTAITSLSESLKTPAEKIWTTLIVQQTIRSISYLIIMILTLIGILFITKIISKSKWGDRYHYDSDDKESTYWKGHRFNSYATLTIIMSFIIIVGLIASVFIFIPMLTGFINPEYGAMKEIMSLLK
jgi:hypothetical protein